MKNLALTDYVNLNDSHAKRKNIIKLLITFVVLLVVYQLEPLISRVVKNIPLQIVGYIIVTALIAYIGIRIMGTTKIAKKPIKLGKVTLTIFVVFVVLWMLILLIDKIKIAQLSSTKIIRIFTLAIMAGIIEEVLFRGLIFDIFVELFSKKKYVFIWAAILESLCFALGHFLNLSHQSFTSTLGEVFGVFGIGLLLTYMRLASNGLWVGMLFHIYFDISPQLAGQNFGNSAVGLELILMIVLSIIGLSAIYSYNVRFDKNILK